MPRHPGPRTVLEPYRLAREVARREDERIASLVAAYAATGCPFPATLYVEPDYDRLVVHVAGVRLIEVDRGDYVLDGPDHPSAKAARLGLMAAAAYAALEPLPHDHPLGQD
jgi:hypothetical protein